MHENKPTSRPPSNFQDRPKTDYQKTIIFDRHSLHDERTEAWVRGAAESGRQLDMPPSFLSGGLEAYWGTSLASEASNSPGTISPCNNYIVGPLKVVDSVAGKTEWHIPEKFTAERPAINYVHVDHGIPASAHPAASKIPVPSDRPCVVGDPDLLADLAWETGYTPNGITDYLDIDKPVLGLWVNSFTDKTVVVHLCSSGNTPHSMRLAYNMWENEVLTPCGIDGDPFDPLATGSAAATEEHALNDRRVGMGGILKWGLGYSIDIVLRTKDNGIVYTPENYWKPQHEKALKELRAEAVEKGEDPSKVFLTENDVITAWIMRCVVESMNMDPKRTVAGSIAMSLRKAFEGDLIPHASEHPYVGNAFGWGNVLVTAGDVSTKPLSWVARQVRRAINEQGTRQQHMAYYNMVRTCKTGLPIIIFGDGGMYQIGFSNWSKANLFEVDFSRARKEAKGGQCRPLYVQENHGPAKPCDGFFILGKDPKGNYQTAACKLKGQRIKFQEQLDRDFAAGR
ncbi:hypothetical protein QBC45DRAFT_489402 [Copromyces sp. CBS 386.78]|nr:hypothetical protein QBC45DRAFT_489402 [Copromyces sp. CBS 386.78]